MGTTRVAGVLSKARDRRIGVVAGRARCDEAREALGGPGTPATHARHVLRAQEAGPEHLEVQAALRAVQIVGGHQSVVIATLSTPSS